MRYLRYEFTDVVVHKPVNLYVDYFGRLWLAHGPWSRFRLSRKEALDEQTQGNL